MMMWKGFLWKTKSLYYFSWELLFSQRKFSAYVITHEFNISRQSHIPLAIFIFTLSYKVEVGGEWGGGWEREEGSPPRWTRHLKIEERSLFRQQGGGGGGHLMQKLLSKHFEVKAVTYYFQQKFQGASIYYVIQIWGPKRPPPHTPYVIL